LEEVKDKWVGKQSQGEKMKIKQLAKKTIAGLALVSALAMGQPANAGDWANVKGSVSTKDRHALITVEGCADIGNKIATYGFADAESTEAEPLKLDSIYAEARATYKLNSLVRAIAEYNGGSGYEDTVRIGIALTPNLGRNNFTFVKLLPYETTKDKGPQISSLTSQTLNDRLTASLLADYNTKPKTMYIEATLEYKINKNLSLYVQGRSFGKIGKVDFVPYVGISKSF
jgi:hypothetical protein